MLIMQLNTYGKKDNKLIDLQFQTSLLQFFIYTTFVEIYRYCEAHLSKKKDILKTCIKRLFALTIKKAGLRFQWLSLYKSFLNQFVQEMKERSFCMSFTKVYY